MHKALSVRCHRCTKKEKNKKILCIVIHFKIHNFLLDNVFYKRDLLCNIVSENSREALGIRNAFSYLDNIDRLESSNPKANMEFLIQACDYKLCIIVYLNI